MTRLRNQIAGRTGWSRLGWMLGLLCSAAGAWAQTIEFLPGAPSVYENGTNIAIVVTRVPATGVATVDFMTMDVTAMEGFDYYATNGTLTFNDGESFKLITVSILDDLVPEGPETFNVFLSNPTGGTLGTSGTTVTIFDNDTFFLIATGTFVVREDGTNVVIPVVRTNSTAGSASVDFFTSDGPPPNGALAAFDYTGSFGTLLFNDGQGTNFITIPINDDCLVESNETFFINLTNAIGAQLGNPIQAQITITDNDNAAGTLIFSTVIPSTNVFEGATNFMVCVSRLCGSNGTVTVGYRFMTNFSLGGLCPGNQGAYTNDFTVGGSGTLTWQTGDDQDKCFTVTVTDDLLVELDETIIFELFNPTGGAVIRPDRQSIPVTILFDDQPSGAVDRTHNVLTPLNPTPGANNTVYAAAVYANTNSVNLNRAIIGGDFSAVNAVVRNGIARLNPFGAVDPTFDPKAGADGFVNAVIIQPDDRVLLSGGFSSIDNISRNRVARLNDDGSLDTTFDPGAGADGSVLAMALQTDGKILIAGDFTKYNNVPRRNIARLNADGSHDATFDPGVGADDIVYGVALQPDGKIVLGGAFTAVGGVLSAAVTRLNANGTPDASFEPVTGADNIVYAVAVQLDSRILIGGVFSSYDGVARHSIARLNPDASLDQTFDPGRGFEGAVYALTLQTNGALLVAGEFTSFDGTPRSNLARLYPNGTLDTTFLDSYYNRTQPGTDGFVSALALQTDGNVIIGGSFSSIGGGLTVTTVLPRFNTARLIGNDTPPSTNAPGNVEFVSATYSVDENVLGGVLTVTVRRTNGVLGSMRVNYHTDDGSAHSNVNYVSVSGTLTWNDCDEFTRTFSVPILDNTIVEGNRNFFVTLSDPVGTGVFSIAEPALGFQRSAEVTIVDNDFARGTIGFASPFFNVNESAGNATITVTRTNGATGRVTVQYGTADGSAVNGSDYTGRTNTLTFQSGETNKTFTVPIINDTFQEFEETVNLRLFGLTGGATLGQSNATLLIFSDESGKGSISFVTNEFLVNENAGTATVTLRRTSGSSGAVSVTFLTQELTPGPGAAREGVDYTYTSNVVTFGDGVTTRTVTIPIIADDLVEGNERLGLTLTNVTGGANIGFLTNATLTIVDDDAYGVLSFSAANYYVNEPDGSATIAVVRTGGSSEEVSVDYAATAGTATDGADFTSVAGTLTFPDGVTQQTITVPILDDSLLELAETVSLTLSNFAKASPGPITNAVLTINDDEALEVPAGSVDTLFNPVPGANDVVNAVVLQADGKLVVGGRFTAFNTSAHRRITRLNPDGSVDPSFNPAQGANDTVVGLALQEDGKVLMAGRFTRVGNRNRNGIARLTLSGAVDTSFNPGSGADNPVLALGLQEDGKVLLGGDFSSFNSISRSRIARLNSNGTLDTGFNPGTGASDSVQAIALLATGKILIGGSFTSYNGLAASHLARLNADGSLDGSFNSAVGVNDSVHTIVVQPDGQILVGGIFTAVGATARNRIARLDSDGNLDPTFDPGSGADNDVNALALQPDAKVIVVGDFTSMVGFSRNRIARLNANGSLDTSINFGSGANAFINAVTLQTDEQIIIGGGFTVVNGVSRNRVARLIGGENISPGVLEFSATTYVVSESTSNAVITLVRSSGSSGTVSVDFMTMDGSATAGADYDAVSTNVVFADGETLKTVIVPIRNDAEVEGSETVLLTLSNPSGAALGGLSTSTLVIVSDDSQIGFSPSAYSVSEGVVGGNAVLTVVRGGATNGTLTVDFRTGSGTASSGSDFSATSGTLTFGPGVTNRTIAVPIIDDSLTEANETFTVRLTNLISMTGPQGVLGSAVATVTIVDNDFKPGNLTFSANSYNVSEGADHATLTVLRTNGTTGVITADYFTTSGTATGGVDYVTSAGTVTFADGQTSQNITVPILNDSLVEGDETFFVTLTNATGGAVISGLGIATVLIEDDEFGPGSLDRTFDPGAGANGLVRSLAVQADGKVLLGGAFTMFDGRSRSHITRLQANGSNDLSFNPGTGANALVSSVSAAPDNKVVVGGPFTSVNGVPFNRVARLNTNGSPDTSFNQVPNFNAGVNSLITRSNGRIVVGGGFSLPTFGIIQLRANATVDTAFNPGSGVNGPVLWVSLQPDGRVLVAGTFTQVDGEPRSRVARLNADGSLDTGFVTDAITDGSAYVAVAAPDGKVLVGGDFSSGSGTNRIRLLRLNGDGSLDTSFNAGLGANASVYAIGVQSQGKIIIGGDFTTINGTNRNRYARLLPNGPLDLTFDPGRGANNAVFALAILPDDNILIAGDFSVVNGLARGGVARIRGADATTGDFTGDVSFAAGQATLKVNTLPGGSYVLEATTDFLTWLPVSTNTASANVTCLLDPGAGSFEFRFYRVRLEP